MKLARFEILHCDAGWRNFSFLKLETADGLTGVSEFNESYGSPGLSAVITGLAEHVLGDDPRAHERIGAKLYAFTRQAPGGIACQAAAAIENALLDLKGKALGVPVYQLLGGPVRDRLRAIGRMAAPENLDRLQALAAGEATAPDGRSYNEALLWLARLAPDRARSLATAWVQVPIADRDRAESGVLALSMIGDDQAMDLLVRLVREPADIEVKRLAYWVLSASEHPKAVAMFEEILGSS